MGYFNLKQLINYSENTNYSIDIFADFDRILDYIKFSWITSI